MHSCKCVQVYKNEYKHIGLFVREIGLFRRDIGLICGDTGLFSIEGEWNGRACAPAYRALLQRNWALLWRYQTLLQRCTRQDDMGVMSSLDLHSRSLQHTAPHCNILQRTLTHCNTL